MNTCSFGNFKPFITLASSGIVFCSCKLNQLLRIASRSLVGAVQCHCQWTLQPIHRRDLFPVKQQTRLQNSDHLAREVFIPDEKRRKKFLLLTYFLDKMDENQKLTCKGQEGYNSRNSDAEKNSVSDFKNSATPINLKNILSLEDGAVISTEVCSVNTSSGYQFLGANADSNQQVLASKPSKLVEPVAKIPALFDPGKGISTKVCTGNTSSEYQTLITNVDSDPDKHKLVVNYSTEREDLLGQDSQNTQSDSSSFGTEMLFDEQSPSDKSTLGLEKLFDETIQTQEAEKWKTEKKNAVKLSRRQRRRLKRKLDISSESENEATDEVDEKKKKFKKKKPRKPTPNYFVAIRVSNPEIHAALKNAQEMVVEHDSKLKPALIPLETLHLTLMVMYLENEDVIAKAKSVLLECKDELKELLCGKQIIMNFTGLDNFRNEVLYSKVADQEQVALLKSIALVVRKKYDAAGISSTDEREFQPHLTVMKLSRKPKLRKKGIKKIPKECYSKVVDEHFGVENASALHLCSMIHKKAEDGFYFCLETVDAYTDSDIITPDHASQSTEIYPEKKESTKYVSKDEEMLDLNSISEELLSQSSKVHVDLNESNEPKSTKEI